jgi:hypothetical protein
MAGSQSATSSMNRMTVATSSTVARPRARGKPGMIPWSPPDAADAALMIKRMQRRQRDDRGRPSQESVASPPARYRAIIWDRSVRSGTALMDESGASPLHLLRREQRDRSQVVLTESAVPWSSASRLSSRKWTNLLGSRGVDALIWSDTRAQPGRSSVCREAALPSRQ